MSKGRGKKYRRKVRRLKKKRRKIWTGMKGIECGEGRLGETARGKVRERGLEGEGK